MKTLMTLLTLLVLLSPKAFAQDYTQVSYPALKGRGLFEASAQRVLQSFALLYFTQLFNEKEAQFPPRSKERGLHCEDLMNLPDGAVARLGKGRLKQVLYSPVGTRLAVQSSIGIWLYDTTTYRVVALLAYRPDWIWSIAFSPDGRTLAAESDEGRLQLWNTETWEPKRTFTGHMEGIIGVKFSPDGSTLASASSDGTVLLWKVD